VLITAMVNDEFGEKITAAQGATIKWRIAMATVPSALDKTKVAAELTTAFNEWAAASGLAFEQVGPKEEAQVTFNWADATPHNTFVFDGPGGALAYTHKLGVTFDAAERWELFDETHPQRSRGKFSGDYFFKLLPVALHEIGHVLGLGHSWGREDVMNPFYVPTKKSLSAVDKARIAELVSFAA